MSCPRLLEYLNDRLDGRDRPLPPELRQHLADCASCRARAAAARRLEEALPRLSPPRPPTDLADRLVAGVLADQGRRRVRREARVLRIGRMRQKRRLRYAAFTGAGALAAGVIVALVIVGRGGSGPEVVQAPLPPAQTAPEPVPMPREVAEAPSSVQDHMLDAATAAAALTRKAAGETLASGAVLWPEVRLPEPADAWPDDDGAAESLRAARQGVSSSFQPLADSARRALALLRRGPAAPATPDRPGL